MPKYEMELVTDRMGNTKVFSYEAENGDSVPDEVREEIADAGLVLPAYFQPFVTELGPTSAEAKLVADHEAYIQSLSAVVDEDGAVPEPGGEEDSDSSEVVE